MLEDGWTVVTADHKLAAHWEHTVAIFPDHTEILTLPLEQWSCLETSVSEQQPLKNSKMRSILQDL
jgi:hypothetical protein